MLMGPDEARSIGEQALKMTSADDAVVSIDHSREATTRFANNSITQNVFTEQRSISLKLAFGGRVGSASSDSTDPEALKSLVERAEAIAKVAPPDPEFLPSLGPQQYLDVNAYFESTAAMTPEERANLALRIIEPARTAGLQAAGTVETSANATTLITSNGLFAYHPRTDAQIGCTVTASDSSGWARDVTVDVARIDPRRLGAAAIEQAQNAAGPKEMAPGKYTVVLMPAAAGHLAEYLLWWANARTTQEGLTYLSDKLGQKLAGDNITLYTDPQDTRLPGVPFGGDGVPRVKTTWIDKGTFGQLWWDRWTAHKDGVEPVPFPSSPIMVGTDRGAEDLIAGVERGILVTHFWYVRTVKDDETLVTGMTRDGTFYIEDGRVKHGVKNFRFNESCLGMLQRTVDIGKPGSCADVELMPSLFPPIVVTDWNFVSATDF